MRNLVVFLAIFFFLGSTSLEGQQVFLLDNPDSNLAGNPGPYGAVQVFLNDPNSADVVFQRISPYAIGSSMSANINAISFSITSGETNVGPSVADGFGSFNLTLLNNDPNKVIEIITINQPGTWASAEDVIVGNALGFPAAMNFRILGSATTLGFASTTLAVAVPELATWMILGSMLGLGLLVSMARKGRQSHPRMNG